jgi:hypothetical protein
MLLACTALRGGQVEKENIFLAYTERCDLLA